MEYWLMFVVWVIVIGGIGWLMKPEPLPRLLVYSQPGKWYQLKFQLMRFIIAYRQRKANSSEAKSDDLMETQFGSCGKRLIEDMERKHSLPEDKAYAADAIFYNASNKDGFFLNLGMAQRQNNIINLFFVLHVPGVGTFVVPEMMMNTNLESLESSEEWATKSGFRVRCLKPMRQWSLVYNGNLVRSRGERYFTEIGGEDPSTLEGAELTPAEINLLWTNYGEHFDFDKACSPTSIAHSLAIEPWSRELFDRLKASHQSHYEQFGFLKGDIRVGEHSCKEIEMMSMRDHTITPYRNWADIRRYMMIIYHLDDGTCIHTSLISMPGVVFTHLEFGYVVTPAKKLHAVDRIYLHLADVGEKKTAGLFPRKFNYSFVAGPLEYGVKVSISESHSFKMGLQQASQVNEMFATFIANGVKGRGFVEMEYRISPY